MILSKHPIINAYYLNVVITWNRRLSKSFLSQWCESTAKHPMDSCWRPLILHQSRPTKTTYLLHFLHLKIRGKNHYIKEMDCSRHENCFHLKMVQKKYIIYFRHAHPTQIITHKNYVCNDEDDNSLLSVIIHLFCARMHHIEQENNHCA